MLDRLSADGIDAVSFDGGEPTESPVLVNAVQHAKMRGFEKIGVVTNGLRFANERFLREVWEAGLSVINFSLHAPGPETSRRIHGRDLSSIQFAALDNIKKYQEQIELTLQTVLVRQNSASLKQLLEVETGFAPQGIILIYCIPDRQLTKSGRRVLVRLGDGEVVGCLEHFARQHPEMSLVLRNFPFCKVPEEYWTDMQGSSPPPVNIRKTLRGMLPFWEDWPPNHMLCHHCERSQHCNFPLVPYMLQEGASRMKTYLDLVASLFGSDRLSRRYKEECG
jgi:hypothetical protein